MRFKNIFLLFFLITAGVVFLAQAQSSGQEDKIKVLREAANCLAQLRPDLAKELNGYADEEAAKNDGNSGVSGPAPVAMNQFQQAAEKNTVNPEQPAKAKGQPGIYLVKAPYMSSLYVDKKYYGDAEKYKGQSSPLYLSSGNHIVMLKDPNNGILFEGNVTLQDDGGLVAVR
jgi:hypothetical protein